jgi:hypothetical protein
MLESPFLTRICQIAGVVLAITSVLLTAQFGLSISLGMMAALAVVSFMASYLPAVMVEVYESGRRWLLYPGLVVAVLVTAIDVTTNASTTGVHKSSDVTQARVQTVKYTDTRDAVASAKDEVALFSKLIADLKEHNPWATSVSAEGLRGQIPALEEAIRQEARRGGCGPKCLALQKELAGLQERIGIAEKLDEHTRKLEAAKRGLERAIAGAAATRQGESAVETQNVRLASLFTLSRQPSEDAQHWTDQWLMVAIGLVITLASQFFNILGFVGPRSGAALRNRIGLAAGPAPSVPQSASGPSVIQRVIETSRIAPRTAHLFHA